MALFDMTPKEMKGAPFSEMPLYQYGLPDVTYPDNARCLMNALKSDGLHTLKPSKLEESSSGQFKRKYGPIIQQLARIQEDIETVEDTTLNFLKMHYMEDKLQLNAALGLTFLLTGNSQYLQALQRKIRMPKTNPSIQSTEIVNLEFYLSSNSRALKDTAVDLVKTDWAQQFEHCANEYSRVKGTLAQIANLMEQKPVVVGQNEGIQLSELLNTIIYMTPGIDNTPGLDKRKYYMTPRILSKIDNNEKMAIFLPYDVFLVTRGSDKGVRGTKYNLATMRIDGYAMIPLLVGRYQEKYMYTMKNASHIRTAD